MVRMSRVLSAAGVVMIAGAARSIAVDWRSRRYLPGSRVSQRQRRRWPGPSRASSATTWAVRSPARWCRCSAQRWR